MGDSNQHMKKKVILLGASGMMGSAFVKTLMQEHDVTCPVRSIHPFLTSDLVTNIKLKTDVSFLKQIKEIAGRIKPDLIINCVGLIKQKSNIKYDDDLVRVNAILPTVLSDYCSVNNIWLIHFSTDCVFEGIQGNYVEQDLPNPQDIYGLTKLVGEDIKNESLVIRTSIIGHENVTANSLTDWFLSQKGQVNGYKNAWFSGLTTVELSKIISIIIKHEFGLKGLYHLSGPKINKSELLKLIAEIYDRSISIIDCENPVIDRSLIDERFRQKTKIPTKSWTEMLQELKKTYGK